MSEQPMPLATYSKDFLEKIKQLKEDMHAKYMDISDEVTPPFDGAGNPIIKKRWDNLDYLEVGYMAKKLDKYFPGWSWEGMFMQFIGGIEQIAVGGHLCIIDEYLLAFGITPPVRKFFGAGAERIQFQVGQTRTAEHIVDLDKNVASANSRALKRAINRLTFIGDDVYGKRFDEEGAGSLEEVMVSAGSGSTVARDMFFNYLAKKKILHSKAMGIMGASSWAEVTDWKEALDKIKEEL